LSAGELAGDNPPSSRMSEGNYVEFVALFDFKRGAIRYQRGGNFSQSEKFDRVADVD
jgi:hypothetical protein